MSPPLPTLRPARSFFFFAVRTFAKWISMLEGNCSAGLWKERASCLDSRVLYYKNRLSEYTGTQWARRLTKGSCSFCAG